MRILTWLLAYSFVLISVITAIKLPKPDSFTKALASRQAVKGDGYGGEGYTVRPLLRGQKPCTTILIHGLGGSGEEWGFVSLALSFFSLNYVKFIIPSAPRRPVTYLNEELPSWFNIFRKRGLSTTLNRAELLQSVERMNRIIQGEIRAGVSPDRIFVIGFSQGGAVALTTFLRSKWSIGGCIGVATWLPLANEYPGQLSSKIRKKDILLLHGTKDTAVTIEYARLSRNVIARMNQPVNLTEIPNGGHILFNVVVIESIENFIIDRANGTNHYLKNLVADLTNTFRGFNSRLTALRI